MGWFTGTVLFVLIWWTVLFAVLPLWVRSQPDADAASGWTGAPEHPHLGRKVVVTTAISVLVWLVVFGVQASGWVSFRSGWWAMPGN